MKIDLRDRIALVSGSTGGIGFAIARGLAKSGAFVVINGRTQAAIDRAVAAIKEDVKTADVRGIAADLSTAAGCDVLAKNLPACDILVNNLGVYRLQDFFEIPDSEWTRFFEINVMSGVRLSRAYMPEMLKRN